LTRGQIRSRNQRICPTTGKKFYDLNKNPVISPYTGEVVRIEPIPRPGPPAPTLQRAPVRAAPEPVEAEELCRSRKPTPRRTRQVKAVVPESEDDIEIDETIEDDDDDDDSTVIATRKKATRTHRHHRRRRRDKEKGD